MTISFRENNNYQQPTEYLTTDFDLYCGALLTSTKGYCNYPISVLEDFGNPSDDNYKEWFQIKDFLNHSEKIKIVRPIPTTTIANHELQLAGTTITSTGIKDCYNPTIAVTTLEEYEPASTLSIISKNIEVYDSDVNYSYSICSTLANFDEKIFSDTDLTIFNSNLLNENGDIKSYRELSNSATPIFASDEFIIIECIKESGYDWKFNKRYIVSYTDGTERYINEQTIDHSYIIKGLGSSAVETHLKSISQCSFQSYSDVGISTDNFTLSQSDYISALTVLKAETNLKGILSIEYNDSMDLVGTTFSDVDVFNFVGCYSLERYLSQEKFYVTSSTPTNGSIDIAKDSVITINTNIEFLESDLTSAKVWLEEYDSENDEDDLVDVNTISSKTLKIIDDFKPANKGQTSVYFSKHRDNTILISNMYRIWDDANSCYRWIPYMGKFAGLIWEKELKLPVDTDDYIENNRLMFSPNEDDRKSLLDKNINVVMNRNKQNYFYGNKIIHDKLVINEIFNSGIIECMRYDFSILWANIPTIYSKRLLVEKQQISSSIGELIIRYYPYISNNSISYNTSGTTLTYQIIIWLKNTIDDFEIEMDINIK